MTPIQPSERQAGVEEHLDYHLDCARCPLNDLNSRRVF